MLLEIAVENLLKSIKYETGGGGVYFCLPLSLGEGEGEILASTETNSHSRKLALNCL